MTEPTAPIIGMGATRHGYSDSFAGTIIAISDDYNIVTWQEDLATRTDSNGMSDQQSYSYAPNKYGKVKYFKRSKKGAWREVEKTAHSFKLISGGNRLALGIRARFHDYSF